LTWLILWLVTGSIAGAACISTTYDPFSVGCQMLWHTGWYLAVWMGPALWVLWGRMPARWREWNWLRFAAVLTLLVLVWQLCRGPSLQEQRLRAQPIWLTKDDWAALQYIRSNLPLEAVTIVIPPVHQKFQSSLFSGVGGRRTYLEYVPLMFRRSTSLAITRFWPEVTYTDKYRLDRILKVWNATSDEEFRQALPPIVTHVVEEKSHLLAAHPSSCLKQVWVSPAGQVVIWEVVH
jgi:hypothetical protein